jgi:hypothetical protein
VARSALTKKLSSGIKRATNASKTTSKFVEEAKGGKFEVKVNLKKMEIITDRSSQYKVQIRCPEVFKVVSKMKYQLVSPHGEETKTFEGEIEFHEDDLLSKVTMLPLSRETG